MNGPTEPIESGLWGDILLSKTLPAAARRLKADASWEINIEGNLFSHLGTLSLVWVYPQWCYLFSSIIITAIITISINNHCQT